MNFYTLLQLYKRVKSTRLKALGVWGASALGLRHLSVRIDPVLQCNLACRMCYFSNPENRHKANGMIKKDELEGIAKTLFPYAFQLVVGCSAEPTLMRHYHELFRLAQKYGVPDTSLVTNGQLIKRNDLEQMAVAGIKEIVLSVHGVRRETYEYFMQGARYDRLLEVLQTFKELRSEHQGCFPQLRINYTVNPKNLFELKEFFDVFEGYGVNTLQVRPIMDIGGEYKESIGDSLIDEYKAVVAFLSQGCNERSIRLLANTSDAGYQQKNHDAALAELVYTYISPKTAGQLGLDWKSTSHRQYKKADHWHKDLWQIIGGRKQSGGWMARSLKYDTLS